MAWGEAEKDQWFKEQSKKRSYRDDVVRKIEALRSRYEVIQYGALSIDPQAYPLFLVRSKSFDAKKKTALITGGVHGYETSGVHGAIGFLERATESDFNIACFPCVSPWAYETINRWNPKAIDPNRSFYEESPSEESRQLLEAVEKYEIKPFVHFDLHETTDTDNTIFRPALEKRDGKTIEFSEIPDGFYTVADTGNPQLDFQRAVIESVKRVTHIAPPDEKGNIIGEKLQAEGVIYYPLKKLFLCAGLSGAPYTTTTEVYPDSQKVTDAICVDAQIAAIRGGLDYLRNLFSTSR